VQTRDQLHAAVLALIDSVLPAPKGIRLVGVTLSGFPDEAPADGAEAWLLPLPEVREPGRDELPGSGGDGLPA
jgi:DNA polymerase IV